MKPEEVSTMVERVLLKDTGAIEALYRCLELDLAPVLRREIREQLYRVDFLHDVFLEVLENLPKLRNPRKLFRWVWKITRSKLAGKQRDWVRGQRALDRYSDIQRESDHLLWTDEIDWIESLARGLPERQKMLLSLIFIQHLDDTEVRRKMSLTNDALKGLKKRMVKNLKANLFKEGFSARGASFTPKTIGQNE